jgi:hypothetical protein
MGRWRLPRIWALWLVFLGVACVPAYATFARYDTKIELGGDIEYYVAHYKHQPVQEILRPYRWRVLMPYVASLLPFLPESLTTYYKVDEDKVITFKFMVVNLLGTLAAACFLQAFMAALGFSFWESALGGLLYLTSFQGLTNGYTMFVDPWANAAMAACLYFAVRGQLLALGLSFFAGMFVKESVVIVVPLVWLLGRKDRYRQLAVLAPGVLAYAVFRLSYPGGPGVTPVEDHWALFLKPTYLAYLGIELVLNFGLLAPLAYLGWAGARKGHPALCRLAWILPLLFMMPFILNTEAARVWFASFTVLMPLAVLGIRQLLGWEAQPLKLARTKRRS